VTVKAPPRNQSTPGSPAPAFHSPFAQLASLDLPIGQAAAQVDTAHPLAAGPPGPARAVVRLERKHRRGKEVTVVEKLGLSTEELEVWCRDLKRTLGCGGGVEGAAIVLQGDFRTRLPDALGKLGVRRVTVPG
jgi:translation initiation factor 1